MSHFPSIPDDPEAHCRVLSDPTDELLMVIGIFTHFFALETTLAERQFFRALAKLIGRRAARLSSCGIAAIVSKMGYLDEGCSVGADGSLYNVKKHAFFYDYCRMFTCLCRNTLGLLIAYMKVCRIFLATRDGERFLIDISHPPDLSVIDLQQHCHVPC
jgi:hypothetical protein